MSGVIVVIQVLMAYIDPTIMKWDSDSNVERTVKESQCSVATEQKKG
jgi:hypothetical protein